MNDELIKKLKSYFEKDNLPGMDAHLKMTPINKTFTPLKKVKEAGVLILLYYKNNSLYTVFIKRNKYPGVHSGQISLPGGQKEKSDKNLIKTAIRETEEELGIILNNINILGTLTPLYIYVSNFNVLPVVSFIDFSPNFKPDKKEVENILEIDLNDFLNEKHIGCMHFNRLGKKIKAPCFLINNNQIWGATAMIMNEFAEILKKINFQQ